MMTWIACMLREIELMTISGTNFIGFIDTGTAIADTSVHIGGSWLVHACMCREHSM